MKGRYKVANRASVMAHNAFEQDGAMNGQHINSHCCRQNIHINDDLESGPNMDLEYIKYAYLMSIVIA
jgi:hypothetical protein